MGFLFARWDLSATKAKMLAQRTQSWILRDQGHGLPIKPNAASFRLLAGM